MEKFHQLRLLDDVLFAVCIASNKGNTELLLRVLMNRDDLLVIRSYAQYPVRSIASHSVTFDVYARDSEGKHYNVEVQRSNSGAIPKRARYHSSMLDRAIMQKNTDYAALPESYVIFITENDLFEAGLPVYHVERVIMETNKNFNDQAHIVYVNTKYVNGVRQDDKGLSPLEKLMHDFRCTDPDDMYYEQLANTVRYYKENSEGVQKLSSIFDEIREEVAEEYAEKQKKYEQEYAEKQKRYEQAFAEKEKKYEQAFAEKEKRYEQAFAEKEKKYEQAFAEKEKKYAEERAASERKLAEERAASERKLAEAQAKLVESELNLERSQAMLAKAQADTESRAIILSAIRMMKDGVKAEKISEYIGMPLEQVQELAALIA
ncbi:MAG: PD-(D/E)XK nuclease family transposase [Clostridia bacterium]|nr:PD-(D/E)XK nuclease family transposase [Clostridia bacterium]